ncbi:MULTISPECIES: EAL domain-containing protein [Burkholderia cepacia complex]|uniref:EAL domain-containing protein n=1 Tax=Burkholderia cepacia complex TaxID=87882 RepID=UPI001C96F135|nr:EAL domain-containing protein [Burkholderia cepacia]MBY4806082.1 EAL domain-containing protein [Burkholderia cepacia]
MSHCVKALMKPALVQDEMRRANSDIRAVRMLLAAIARGRVMLCAQPIVSAQGGEHVLYYECLVRIVGEEKRPIVYPSAFIPSLERLECMRFLDRYVVGMVIDFMESNGNLRLGVNISAQSANDVRWWESILLRLESRPDIACRLVVEITETTQLSFESGQVFVERLRRLGCAIAVDDFGDGFSEENSTRITSLDIIKIAGRMLPADDCDHLRRNRFEKLVARARNLANHVVVEGIEGVDGLRTAALAGAQWVQGYHTGRPGRLRKAECSTVGSLEKSMRQFERVADALMDRGGDKKTRDDAKLAYTFGLSSALYGRHSAIAAGLYGDLIDVMRMNSDRSDVTVQLLQCFVVLGRLNGQISAVEFESGTST